jgi:putative ABC transport system permease protein
MFLILKISWRNIWRNPKRSLVMIISIAVGLWGGIFVSSLSFGLLEQRFITSIEQHISHIQVHHPEFLKERNVKFRIADYESLHQFLTESRQVKAFSGRSVLYGMLGAANLTQGVNIIGIDPAMEARTTRLDQNLLTGEFFGEENRNSILIGKKLADKTKVQERSRIVLTFQNAEGELVSGAFRVAGIFQSSNAMFDEMNVYVTQNDIGKYIGSGFTVNEVAIVMEDPENVLMMCDQIKTQFPEHTVRNWAEISPELSYLQEMAGMMLTIILSIILFALAFGLVNTMLMSVFERIRELGMLMAVGMNKRKVFAMIFWETTYLTFLGALVGIVFAIVTITLFRHKGLDLSAVGGDSLNDFGFSSVIYPHLEPGFFLTIALLVFLTAILTSVYPTLKALKLKPSEAIRKD